MKNSKLLAIHEQLNELAKIEGKQPNGVLPFPSATRLRLHRNFKAVCAAVDDYEQARVALVKQFGTKHATEESYKVEADKLPDFAKEFTALQNEEADVKLEPIHDEQMAAANVPFVIITALEHLGVVTAAA